MAEHRLQHFQFADPLQAACRSTRCRLLKRRRKDEKETTSPVEAQAEDTMHEDIEVYAEDTISTVHEAVGTFDFVPGTSDHDINEDVDLPEEIKAYDISTDDNSEIDDDVNLTEEECVFHGCPLAKSSSNVLILQYSVRHNLTVEATTDLFELLRLHCPAPNTIPPSMHCFRKQFQSLTYPSILHYFCSNCLQLIPNKEIAICPNISCGKSLKTFRALSSFIELSLEEQIINLMERMF